jgi:hypothetical protein
MSKLKRQVLERSSGFCIYCGGISPATTVDHMPPIVLFRAKDRPKGLEFASCADCNRGAAHSDLVAALFGRAYPNLSPDEADEMKAILKGVSNNIPGLLAEMMPSVHERMQAARKIGISPSEHKFIKMDGPIAMRHLRSFGARFGSAMHFHHTGFAIPAAGGVSVRIYSNINLIAGDVPDELFAILPQPETLRAGRKNVDAQFKYAARAADTKGMTISFASFRLSFGIMAAAVDDVQKLADLDLPAAAGAFRPGHLKQL